MSVEIYEVPFFISDDPILSLRNAQGLISEAFDPSAKREIAEYAFSILPLESLIGEWVELEAKLAFAKSEDIDEKDRLVLNKGVAIKGLITDVDYRYNLQIPNDDILLFTRDFELLDDETDELPDTPEPTVFEAYHLNELELPVAAFQRWSFLEAA